MHGVKGKRRGGGRKLKIHETIQTGCCSFKKKKKNTRYTSLHNTIFQLENIKYLKIVCVFLIIIFFFKKKKSFFFYLILFFKYYFIFPL